MPTRRAVAVMACVLALAAFAVIQDRVTAAGARRYAAAARAAVAAGRRPPRIEDVMTPAIRSSVAWGAAGAMAVLVLGAAVSILIGRKANS